MTAPSRSVLERVKDAVWAFVFGAIALFAWFLSRRSRQSRIAAMAAQRSKQEAENEKRDFEVAELHAKALESKREFEDADALLDARLERDRKS